jgi:hypothetical protein
MDRRRNWALKPARQKLDMTNEGCVTPCQDARTVSSSQVIGSPVHMRRPIGPHIRAAMTAPRADHASTERSDWRLVRHVVGIHGGTVTAMDRVAVH